MALADTGRAIGAVTEAIRLRLGARTGLSATVGRPEPPVSSGAIAKSLNLFLYEAQFDANLKNTPLDEGQRPPLWLILKYMLTAFDDGKNSDTVQALEYLGEGLRALQELTFLPVASGLPPNVLKALSDNPETLRITFDEATPELLSKLMQGSDEKYRLSAAFQVRPVMIAPAEPPSYSLLVGVDYTTAPAPTIIGEAGVHIPVLPTMGPVITKIDPESFDPGATITLEGTDLHVADLSVMLGPVELPVTMQQPDRLQFVVNEAIATPGVISAGSHPVSVSQLLPGGRRRGSNLLVGNLRPVLDTATILAGSIQPSAPPMPPGLRFATIDLTGKYLGRNGVDDFYLALYRDGATVKLFDALSDTSPPGAPQTGRRFAMQNADAVPPGQYLVLYRVNGQQARQAVPIDLT